MKHIIGNDLSQRSFLGQNSNVKYNKKHSVLLEHTDQCFWLGFRPHSFTSTRFLSFYLWTVGNDRQSFKFEHNHNRNHVVSLLNLLDPTPTLLLCLSVDPHVRCSTAFLPTPSTGFLWNPYFNSLAIYPRLDAQTEHCWWQKPPTSKARGWDVCVEGGGYGGFGKGKGKRGREGREGREREGAAWDIPLSHGNAFKQ